MTDFKDFKEFIVAMISKVFVLFWRNLSIVLIIATLLWFIYMNWVKNIYTIISNPSSAWIITLVLSIMLSTVLFFIWNKFVAKSNTEIAESLNEINEWKINEIEDNTERIVFILIWLVSIIYMVTIYYILGESFWTIINSSYTYFQSYLSWGEWIISTIILIVKLTIFIAFLWWTFYWFTMAFKNFLKIIINTWKIEINYLWFMVVAIIISSWIIYYGFNNILSMNNLSDKVFDNSLNKITNEIKIK